MLNVIFLATLAFANLDERLVVFDGTWSAIEREFMGEALRDADWIRSTSLYAHARRIRDVSKIHLRLTDRFYFTVIRHGGRQEFFFEFPRDADPLEIAFYLGQRIPLKLRTPKTCVPYLL